MKISSDKDKLKAFSTEINPEYARLIDSIGLRKSGGVPSKFAASLDNVAEWCSVFGKTEMGRWSDVLADCSALLGLATSEKGENGEIGVDVDEEMEGVVISILRFHSLLFENTFSRSIYGSIEQLIKLLDSRKTWIVTHTLRLLMCISKSSRFISQHISVEIRQQIHIKLMAILEAWSGKVRNIPIKDFCSENYSLPSSMCTIQIRSELPTCSIDLDKPFHQSNAELKKIASGCSEYDEAEKTLAHFKLRFAYSTKNTNERYHLVMARFISVSVFFYSRCLITEEWRLNSLANDQFIEMCSEVLHFECLSKYQALCDAVKTEALKTLASVVFLEKAKKISLIVQHLELNSYHGFAPTLLRSCIENLKAGKVDGSNNCSVGFITSLFSLVYHIAGFEYGGDSLNRCSLISSLLSLVKTYNLPDQYISFVTRAIRIVDILTSQTDVTEFNANEGSEIIISRFSYEVEQCKSHMRTANQKGAPFLCNQQRSALMKSLLNFLKRAVLDVNLATQMRRIMETDLPTSLLAIIDNPQYYGSSLLHCAITLTTNFIYQEPTQLNMLQEKGLTDAVMRLIFNEKFPISRDLVCALPNVCSALCLNERGLSEIKSYKGLTPLEKVFRVIFSNKFLLSMRKRKTEIMETAHMLGSSFDELIRHQPTLRKEVMTQVANLVDEMLSFEDKCAAEGKKCVVSWSVGKNQSVVEDNSTELLPLGDYLAMLGVLLETLLTNRGQDNVMMANECGIAIRLIKLITEAKHPNPIMLQSNYLHTLANIVRYVMMHSNKLSDAFVHLISCSVTELKSYTRCETLEDASSEERLAHLTRLCALISTLNSLMKSSISSQNSNDMRPLMLQYFATEPTAKMFIDSLFDAYKTIGGDRLIVNCNGQQATTTQILEDTTKVRELLIDDEISQQDSLMDMDNNLPQPIASISDAANSSALEINYPNIVIQIAASNANQLPQNSLGLSGGEQEGGNTDANGAPAGTSKYQQIGEKTVVERSNHTVAIRCLKQISELLNYTTKVFCNVNLPRVRRNQPISDPATMRKHSIKITEYLFGGMRGLLKVVDGDGTEGSVDNKGKTDPAISAPNTAQMMYQSLSMLKKLLEDFQSLQILLPNFYKSGCHAVFFSLVERFFRPNIAQKEFGIAMQAWLNISQRLISTQMLASTTKRGNGQQKPIVDGFEMKYYLAMCHKDCFTALTVLSKALMETCEQAKSVKMDVSSTEDMMTVGDDNFKLLEKVLESQKTLIQNMMELLELTEEKQQVPEIPVSEIDPKKIEQLVEMGFSQSDAVDALMAHTSVPEAAEWILTERATAATSSAHRLPTTAASTAQTAAASIAAAEQTAAELIRSEAADAVNSSIGVQASTSISTNVDSQQKVAEDGASSSVGANKPFSELQKPLTREEFQERIQLLCNEVIGVCLRLARKSDSVLRGLSQLLAVFTNDPLARSWVDSDFIGQLIAELNQHLDELIKSSDEENHSLVQQFASILQLFCLLWMDFPTSKIYKRIGLDTDEA